jgi:hypothetical protein
VAAWSDTEATSRRSYPTRKPGLVVHKTASRLFHESTVFSPSPVRYYGGPCERPYATPALYSHLLAPVAHLILTRSPIFAYITMVQITCSSEHGSQNSTPVRREHIKYIDVVERWWWATSAKIQVWAEFV